MLENGFRVIVNARPPTKIYIEFVADAALHVEGNFSRRCLRVTNSQAIFSSSIGLERGAAVVRAEAIVVVEPVSFALDFS